jgi:SAM-dependent MidA family methyltransferase
MECALYAPGLGYYSSALQKFGSGGDFITAPELSPLFGQCLATQIAQLMTLSAPHVLEAGAGSGRLAADLLQCTRPDGLRARKLPHPGTVGRPS